MFDTIDAMQLALSIGGSFIGGATAVAITRACCLKPANHNEAASPGPVPVPFDPAGSPAVPAQTLQEVVKQEVRAAMAASKDLQTENHPDGEAVLTIYTEGCDATFAGMQQTSQGVGDAKRTLPERKRTFAPLQQIGKSVPLKCNQLGANNAAGGALLCTVMTELFHSHLHAGSSSCHGRKLCADSRELT